jgi:hypothetical protein
MKTKHLGWLLVATYLVWFIPWQAKQLSPAIFGTSYILQWGSSVVSALLLSLGLFLSIRALHLCSPEKRRDAGWICIGFTTLFCLVMGSFGVGGPMFARTSCLLNELSANDAMLRLMPKLQEAKTEKHRQKIARGIYVFTGVAVPYQTDSGTYITYSPTQKDSDSWTQNQTLEVKRKETQELVDWQLKQWPWLTSLYIGSFFATFVIGSLILIYKKKGCEPCS